MTDFTLKTFYPDGKEETKNFDDFNELKKQMQETAAKYPDTGEDNDTYEQVYFWVWNSKCIDDGYGTWEHDVWFGNYGNAQPKFSWPCKDLEEEQI